MSAIRHRLSTLLFVVLLVEPLASFPVAAQSFNPPPAGVLTQRYDPQRSGWNPLEHVLTLQAVASSQFQKLYTIPTLGQPYAQPLIVPGVPLPDGSRGTVLVLATMANAVQAFQVDDAIGGGAFPPKLLWTSSVGAPLPANFMAMESSYCSMMLFNICIPQGGHLPAPPLAIPALPPIPSSADFIINHATNALNWNGLGLYNINPFIGIVSTPVIDKARGAIFVVAKVWPSPPDVSTIQHRIFRIDLVSGRTQFSREIGRDSSGNAVEVPGNSADSQSGKVAFNPMFHMQRPALLLQNNRVYVAFGSHQDTPPWHGWVFALDPDTLEQTAVWCSTPNAEGGAIWQAGNGLAGDAQGNVYVMTGNGCTESDCLTGGKDTSSDRSQSNFADMFVQLDPGLNPIGSLMPGDFLPNDQQKRESEDLDVGSSGPVFMPATTVLVGIEKESLLFAMDASTHLGMRQIFQAGQYLDSPSIGGTGFHHNHGDPVVRQNSSSQSTLYFWPERDYLRAFTWDSSKAVFPCAADSAGCLTGATTAPDQISTFPSPTCPGCMPGGVLSGSSDGQLPNTAIVWASVPFNTQGSLSNAAVGGGLNNIVPGILFAFDADSLSTVVWNSENNPGRDGSFMFAKGNPPVVANGRVYLATFGSTDGPPQSVTGSVNIYGLQQWAKFVGYAKAPPASVTAGARFGVDANFFNAGITTWPKGTVALVAVQPNWNAAAVSIPNDVLPGRQATLHVDLTAPAQFVGGDCTQQGSSIRCALSLGVAQTPGGRFGEATPLAFINLTGVAAPCASGEHCCAGIDANGQCQAACVSNTVACQPLCRPPANKCCEGPGPTGACNTACIKSPPALCH